MRLTRIDIRDYRSILADERPDSFRLELASGANTLVGRNNCGKSNVLRAVSLALDPNHAFDPEVDIPGPRRFAHPIVVLEFVAEGNRTEELELLQAAKAYEAELAPHGTHNADNGYVALEVSFPPRPGGGYWRREMLRSPSGAVPRTDNQHQLLEHALGMLRSAVRFVLIKSGESLESVLEGNFREILHSVVRERLDQAFEHAEQARRDYVTGLQDNLLRPLRNRLVAGVGELFPEIDAVTLAPEVQTIERTLSNVEISLHDLVDTPLVGKGTGVRGGVLVAMLDYLARNATRSMVFAVEEPEAFLHPAAQEDLRDHLQELAATPDVTLLVTTHSPWMVACSADSRVFCLDKDSDGRTRVARWAQGDASHASLLGDLYRERTFEDILAEASSLVAGTRAVLIVEGDGDEGCLRRVADLVGRPDLLEGIEIRPAGGATKLALQAIVTREAVDVPVLVLLDHDEAGRSSGKLLVDKFDFQNRTQVLDYSLVFPKEHRNFPWEAEDLFDPEVIEGFVAYHGDAVVDGTRRRYDDRFHYDLSRAAKDLLDSYFDLHLRPRHIERWLDMILLIRQKAGLPAIDQTAIDLIAQAPVLPDESEAAGGLVLVTAGSLDLARYEEARLLLLDPQGTLPDGITHVAFYADAEIKAQVPRLMSDYPNLLLNTATVAQLRSTGSASDAVTADAVEAVLGGAEGLVDTNHRVILLSAPYDDATFTLGQPVQNTKRRDGRPLAWVVGPRVTTFAALAKHPTTTDELEAFEKEAGQ